MLHDRKKKTFRSQMTFIDGEKEDGRSFQNKPRRQYKNQVQSQTSPTATFPHHIPRDVHLIVHQDAQLDTNGNLELGILNDLGKKSIESQLNLTTESGPVEGNITCSKSRIRSKSAKTPSEPRMLCDVVRDNIRESDDTDIEPSAMPSSLKNSSLMANTSDDKKNHLSNEARNSQREWRQTTGSLNSDLNVRHQRSPSRRRHSGNDRRNKITENVNSTKSNYNERSRQARKPRNFSSEIGYPRSRFLSESPYDFRHNVHNPEIWAGELLSHNDHHFNNRYGRNGTTRLPRYPSNESTNNRNVQQFDNNGRMWSSHRPVRTQIAKPVSSGVCSGFHNPLDAHQNRGNKSVRTADVYTPAVHTPSVLNPAVCICQCPQTSHNCQCAQTNHTCQCSKRIDTSVPPPSLLKSTSHSQNLTTHNLVTANSTSPKSITTSSAAPISAAPISAAPISAAPISTAPITTTSSTAPTSTVPTSTAPSSPSAISNTPNSMIDEIQEEMARAQRMSLPVTYNHRSAASQLSRSNPGHEFSLTLKDGLGNNYIMSTDKGVYYFRPHGETTSNPNYVITTESKLLVGPPQSNPFYNSTGRNVIPTNEYETIQSYCNQSEIQSTFPPSSHNSNPFDSMPPGHHMTAVNMYATMPQTSYFQETPHHVHNSYDPVPAAYSDGNSDQDHQLQEAVEGQYITHNNVTFPGLDYIVYGPEQSQAQQFEAHYPYTAQVLHTGSRIKLDNREQCATIQRAGTVPFNGYVQLGQQNSNLVPMYVAPTQSSSQLKFATECFTVTPQQPLPAGPVPISYMHTSPHVQTSPYMDIIPNVQAATNVQTTCMQITPTLHTHYTQTSPHVHSQQLVTKKNFAPMSENNLVALKERSSHHSKKQAPLCTDKSSVQKRHDNVQKCPGSGGQHCPGSCVPCPGSGQPCLASTCAADLTETVTECPEANRAQDVTSVRVDADAPETSADHTAEKLVRFITHGNLEYFKAQKSCLIYNDSDLDVVERLLNFTKELKNMNPLLSDRDLINVVKLNLQTFSKYWTSPLPVDTSH